MILELSRVRTWRADLARLGQNPALRARGQVLLDTLPTIGENDVEYQKTCEYILCRKDFVSGRKDTRFCSDAHRTAANKAKDTREPSDISKLMTRAIEIDSQFYGGPSSLESKRARNDAFRAVYDAIGAELGIVHERPGSVPELHEVPVPVVEVPVEVPVVESVEGQHERPELHEVPVVEVREKLRAFMAETSFGQSKIAKLVGVGQPKISQFLSGKTKGSEDFRRAILDLVSQDHGMDRR